MPLQATSGAASYDAFGGGVPVVPAYIEEVFSTWLYTGTASPQTITNGIDISTKGGLVWTKSRSLTLSDQFFVDTARGVTKYVQSNSAAAQVTGTDISAFNTNGYSLGSDVNGGFNNNGATFVSWTFREQPKFFDVLTYTGDGTSSQAIAHNLGSTPGCIIIKPLQSASFNDWRVWHRSLTSQSYQLKLNTTEAEANVGNFIGQNSTTFTVGFTGANQSGIQYVAYLFAHDAGGFGLTGTDNVISCGSYTTDAGGEGPVVTLGWEPQWIMQKDVNYSAGSGGDWDISDNMRGLPSTSSMSSKFLEANTSDAEQSNRYLGITSTGFRSGGTAEHKYIYIAIRRGPMKVPTDATKVFNSLLITGNGANRTVTGVGFTPDLFHSKARNVGFANSFYDRLRGATKELVPNSTAAESTDTTSVKGFDVQDGISLGPDNAGNATVNYPGGYDYVEHYFKRAPSFFDEVCYTGTGSATTVAHNLGVTPEWIIVKRRSNNDGAGFWASYSAATGNTQSTQFGTSAAALTNSTFWNNTSPTSTNFTVGTITRVNGSGETYVAYLFATCAGVSKVGSYTGIGATQTIACGFTGGARFVLIKRTDSTGDWYVWDTARGMVSGTDPSLLLNSTAAEVNANSIYTTTGGFQIVSTAAGINASGGSYIFLSIA